jgi:predicted nucleic acid-binding protein
MTVLADTNIWCDHFRHRNSLLVEMLHYDFLVIHEVVIGELAVGGLTHRKQTMIDLREIPRLPLASFSETLHLIEERSLWGKGVQWNDFLLLASVILAGDSKLFTNDHRLQKLARELGVSYDP